MAFSRDNRHSSSTVIHKRMSETITMYKVFVASFQVYFVYIKIKVKTNNLTCNQEVNYNNA